jgi:hypothetical protein
MRREAFVDESKWWVYRSPFDWEITGPVQPDGEYYVETFVTFEEAIEEVRHRLSQDPDAR